MTWIVERVHLSIWDQYGIVVISLNSSSIKYWSIKFWSSLSCVEFWSNMSILKLPIIIMGQEIGIRSKKNWRWIMNISKDNVEGLYIVIIWISILVFASNVAIIYSTFEDVKVLCDDKLMKLSYIIIVSFRPFTLIVECVLASMFKDVLLNINVLKSVSLKHNMWIVLTL